MDFRDVLVAPYSLAIEGQNDSFVTIYRMDSKARLRVGKRVYATMCRFASPCSVETAVGNLTTGERRRMMRSIQTLVEKGFLVGPNDADSSQFSSLRMVSPTLFQCPRGDKSHPGDIAVMGVPFDLACRMGVGSRDAPEAIRKRSWDHDYRVDFLSGRAIGWHDIDRGRRVLEGVDIRDWGDVAFRYGEDPSSVYKRINAVVSEIVACAASPVTIGGDHSITLEIIKGLAARYPRLRVVWLDAHTDTSPIAPGDRHNNGSVVREILALGEIIRVVQVGLRGYSMYDKVARAPEKLSIITAAQLKARGLGELLQYIPQGEPCYVSIDIDILDPSVAPATATPMPFGLSAEALRDILTILDQQQVVVGLDLMEVTPALDHGIVTMALACHLLIAGISAITSFRTAAKGDLAASLTKQQKGGTLHEKEG